MFLLDLLEAGIGAMQRVEVKHHKTRNDAGDDREIGVRPASEPLADLWGLRTAVLVDLPPDQGLLPTGLDGDDRPAQTAIVERGLRQNAA
jgi:hypothetical protein